MPKKCKNCGNPFIPKYSSLEKYCWEWDCRIKDAREKVAKKKQAEKKQADKIWKIKKAELTDNTTNWQARLQVEINKIVRLIDKGLPCLARKKGGKMHAGHVFSRGSNIPIRYNLHNIHRQNAQSNHFQNDDGLLREGLVDEYGQEYMNFISELRRTPVLKYKDFEYEEFTKNAREIVKDLAKRDLKYSLEDRIKLRNEINIQMEIYPKEFCSFINE